MHLILYLGKLSSLVRDPKVIMSRIFANIALHLLPNLREAIKAAYRADFCDGYLNLRDWKAIGDYIENWSGRNGECIRLLVGMQRLPQDEFRTI